MTRHIPTIFLLTILFSCSDKKSGDNQTFKEYDTAHVRQLGEKQFSDGQENINNVSDTLKKIIDDLNLCQYSQFLNTNKTYNCYSKDISDIRNIKSGDNSYDNFIFQAPGGSGGGAIIVFCKKDSKYQKIQDYEGYIDSILPSTTKGFHDIRVWHRAKKVDDEMVLFKWTGSKYDIKKMWTN